MIDSASEIEALALTVEDNGGVFFVPAFAGLLAPHWRGDARGLMCGLTAYNTKAHVARAVLESTAFQVMCAYMYFVYVCMYMYEYVPGILTHVLEILNMYAPVVRPPAFSLGVFSVRWAELHF